MQATQLREAANASPFAPFTIRMVTGETYPVDNPDKLAIALEGDVATLLPGGGEVCIIEIPEIVEIAPAPTPAESK